MWARIINTALGVWLMAAPAVLGYGNPAENNDRIVGPLIAAFAFVGICEITRGLRRVNTLTGLWLILAPFVLGYPTTTAIVNSVCVGILVTVLSFLGGKVKTDFGGGWAVLFQKHAGRAEPT